MALFGTNGKGLWILLGMLPALKLLHGIPDWFGCEGSLKPRQCHGQGHSPQPCPCTLCCCWLHSPLVEESVVLHLRRIGKVFQDSIQQWLHPFVLQGTSHEDRGEGFLQRRPSDCQLENIPVSSTCSTA